MNCDENNYIMSCSIKARSVEYERNDNLVEGH